MPLTICVGSWEYLTFWGMPLNRSDLELKTYSLWKGTIEVHSDLQMLLRYLKIFYLEGIHMHSQLPPWEQFITLFNYLIINRFPFTPVLKPIYNVYLYRKSVYAGGGYFWIVNKWFNDWFYFGLLYAIWSTCDWFNTR